MTCIIENCTKESYCKGMCNTHYKNKWQKDNLEKRKQILHQYHLSDKHKNTHSKYNKTSKGRFSYLKNSVRVLSKQRRNIKVDISLEEYENIIKNSCYYCNGPLFKSSYGHGLDRINNDLGYELSNILPACSDCNQLRGNKLTVEETKAVVNLLKQLRNKENIWD